LFLKTILGIPMPGLVAKRNVISRLKGVTLKAI